MNTPNEEPKAVENSAHNPFPEPQTIPAGWDLSEMFFASQSEMIADEEEAESK